jgi:hypothetical protein
MAQVQQLTEATDFVYANAVRLFDKDRDGALGFQNAEFAKFVYNLLVRRDDLPGVSDEDFNAGDRARKESALRIARVIASHPGFSGQSGATPSALRAATEAGVFQELTPVMQGWIEPAVKKVLLRLQGNLPPAIKVPPAIPAGISQHREFHSMPVEREATARWNYHWFPQYRGNQSTDCTWNHHSAYHSASASMDCT